MGTVKCYCPYRAGNRLGVYYSGNGLASPQHRNSARLWGGKVLLRSGRRAGGWMAKLEDNVAYVDLIAVVIVLDDTATS